MIAAALRARRQGARYVVRVLREARRAGIEPALALALVQRESDFRNAFGSDRVEPPQLRTVRVTRRRYRRYRELRAAGHGNQGVGLTQLTWPAFQDDADAAGGLHKPRVQLRTGYAVMAGHIERHGERAGVAAYNGSGPRAERYADEVLDLKRRWQRVLDGRETARGLPVFGAKSRQPQGESAGRG